MRIVTVIIVAVAGLAMLPVLYTIINMIFISEITQGRVAIAKSFHILQPGITVSEKTSSIGIVGYHYDVPPGDAPAGKEQVMLPDGTFRDGYRVLDGEEGRDVISVDLPDMKFVFNRDEVLLFKDGVLIDKKSMIDIGTEYVGAAQYINEKYFALIVHPKESPYPSERVLWLYNYREHSVSVLSKDPCYSSRPPVVLLSEGLEGQLLVYYTGALNYGFGGDSSRPEFSILRFFNSRYPGGIDLVKFHFKAGTIYDAHMEKGALIVQGNPSLPLQAGKDPSEVREWIIEGEFLKNE